MAKGIDTSALVAAFIAKGGTVQEVAPDQRALTEREIWEARTGERLRERHFVVGSNGVEHCRNGEGEWIY